MPDIENKEFLRPDEVAIMLDICKKTVYSLINNMDNPLPSIKIGGVKRIKRSELEKWLKNQNEKPWE
jgi:excisionase family DNA binding protein